MFGNVIKGLFNSVVKIWYGFGKVFVLLGIVGFGVGDKVVEILYLNVEIF